GLRAHLLRRAFALDWGDVRWLQAQSDASFDFLDATLGELPRLNWENPLFSTLCFASELEDDEPDILALLHRYGLPASAGGLNALEDVLKRDADEVRQKRRAERQALIAPFKSEIELITSKLSDRERPRAPSLRRMIQVFLEQYVIEHGRMPQGEVDVEVKSSREFHFSATMGRWDFDELRTCEQWPPVPDSLPPRCRFIGPRAA